MMSQRLCELGLTQQQEACVTTFYTDKLRLKVREIDTLKRRYAEIKQRSVTPTAPRSHAGL